MPDQAVFDQSPGEASAAEDVLLRADRDGVTELTLNRPGARNALSDALIARLQEAFDAIREDRSVRVVIVSGAGSVLSAGHDLREVRAKEGYPAFADLFARSATLMKSIVRLPQPVIAKVRGMATAAGSQLVASCDLAYAAEEARFATPGVAIGLFCSTPMVPLSRNVGRKQAMEMLLTGDAISAARAVEIGLINAAVPADALDARVEAIARGIAARSARAVAIGKEAFYEQIELGLDAAYEHGARAMATNMLANDAREGIDAFIEKRAPHWSDS